MSRAALVVATLFVAVAYAQAPPPAAIDTLKRIRETGTLLVGVRETSVPFSFLDAQKQPLGYSVEAFSVPNTYPAWP
jgi:glutamate/aspartate transport system substrate-binding protein